VDNDFKLPVSISKSAREMQTVYPTRMPQKIVLKNMTVNDFRVDEMHSYFIIKYE
jgi:hypothetical protein